LDAKYANVLVFEPLRPSLRREPRPRFSRDRHTPAILTDRQKSHQMFGREEFRPVINGITIGLQVLLIFIEF